MGEERPEKMCPIMGILYFCSVCRLSIKIMTSREVAEGREKDESAKERQYICSFKVIAMGMMNLDPKMKGILRNYGSPDKKLASEFKPISVEKYRRLSAKKKREYSKRKEAHDRIHGKRRKK